MNLKEVAVLGTELSAVNDIFFKDASTLTHVGSMGRTELDLVITVMCGDKVLFSGRPKCLGHEFRSNYAYENAEITAPTKSIKDWVGDNFPSWAEVNVVYHFYKDWEGSNLEDKLVTANFNRFTGLSKAEVNLEETSERHKYMQTVVLGDECSVAESTEYFDEEDL